MVAMSNGSTPSEKKAEEKPPEPPSWWQKIRERYYRYTTPRDRLLYVLGVMVGFVVWAAIKVIKWGAWLIGVVFWIALIGAWIGLWSDERALEFLRVWIF